MSDQKNLNLDEGPIFPLLMKMSWPSMTAMLVFALYNLMDSLWLTRLGPHAIAGYAVTFPLQMIFVAFGVGTGVGAGSYAARMFGAGDTEKARKTAGQVLSLSLVLGLALMAWVLIMPETILTIFGATSHTREPALAYIIPVAFGAPSLLFIMMSNNLLRAEGRPNPAMYIQLVFAVVGAVLDPLLIFGWGPVPALGILGAAMSAVTGQVVASLLSLYFLLQPASKYRLRLRHLWPDGSIVYAIYQTGLPSVFMNIVFGLIVIYYNHILSGYGHLALATLGICFRINGLVMMVVFGIGHGVMPMVGFNLGARLYDRLLETVRVALIFSTILAGLSGLVLFFAADPILSLFTTDPALKDVALPALRIFVSMLVLAGPSVVWINMFIGLGKGLAAMNLLLFRDALFLVPSLYLFEAWLGLPGVWLSQPVAVVVGFAVIFFWSRRETSAIASKAAQPLRGR